jgi:hypothetical protein
LTNTGKLHILSHPLSKWSITVPFLEETHLFQEREAAAILRGKSSDLSAQRIQFNSRLQTDRVSRISPLPRGG